MAKKTLAVKAVNMWRSRKAPGTVAYFFKDFLCLNSRYVFKETNRPNFVISVCQQTFPVRGSYTKIFFAGENIKPKMNLCDWAFGFEYEDYMNNHPRYMRIPNYTRLGGGKNLVKENLDYEELMRTKTKFCALVSRGNSAIRVPFFRELSKYKKIDSPGALCNNMLKLDLQPRIKRMGIKDAYRRKIEFYKPYKFIIAIENNSYPGYTTEKLYHGMLSNAVSIYWGNPLINREFNTRSFINCHDLKTNNQREQIEYLVHRVTELDKDDDLYFKTLKQPHLPNNELTRYLDPKVIVPRFRRIFENV